MFTFQAKTLGPSQSDPSNPQEFFQAQMDVTVALGRYNGTEGHGVVMYISTVNPDRPSKIGEDILEVFIDSKTLEELKGYL